MEHSIRAHPSVCDLLVSFAHAALGGQAVSRAGNNSGTTANRMDLPLGIK